MQALPDQHAMSGGWRRGCSGFLLVIAITALLPVTRANCPRPDFFAELGTPETDPGSSFDFGILMPINSGTASSRSTTVVASAGVQGQLGNGLFSFASAVLTMSAVFDPVDNNLAADFRIQQSMSREGLANASLTIKQIFSFAEKFDATYGFTITWCEAPVGTEVLAFQVVVVTNEIDTFMFYNYGSVDADSSTATGIAFVPIQQVSQAVIGDDLTAPIPFLTLSTSSNIGCPGQWLFQINRKAVKDGSCRCGAHGTLVDGECECAAGFTWDGTQCLDTDECALETYLCPYGSACVNIDGGAECHCNDGFQELCGECIDVDECFHEDSCPVTSMCMNTEGSYQCHCLTGYTSGDSVVTECIDEDECLLGTHTCDPWTTCRNTVGSFSCSCIDGFSKDFFGQCLNDNECDSRDTNNCGYMADCVDTYGSYHCQCREGFYMDNGDCRDTDECLILGFMPCSPHANCTNTLGSYQCFCNDGYQGDGFFCQDVDECIQGFDGSILALDLELPGVILSQTDAGRYLCDNRALCYNTEGSYSCTCSRGYTGNGVVCQDLDECDIGSHNCLAETSTCSNVPGSFRCKCFDGFSHDGQQCVDLDECQSAEDHGCGDDAFCVNTFGSYECHCRDGFKMVDGNCEDVNECIHLMACSPQANCINEVGFYRCECQDGYWGDGQECQDVDECILVGFCSAEQEECIMSSNNCSPNAICINTMGSYDCECTRGFTGSGFNCTDVDECILGTHTCSPLAECSNTEGYFSCQCNQGFVGDGFFCNDLDECILTGDPECGYQAFCVNTFGSYECQCRDGFQMVDGNCTENIDECRSLLACSGHANCINEVGSYRCECQDGYWGDGQECQDVDECILVGFCSAEEEECIMSSNDCSLNAICINTMGSYDCECTRGFTGGGFNCTDVDECIQGTHTCSPLAECSNTEGSFTCQCNQGYMGDGFFCDDIDECQFTEDHECGDLEECVNTWGSFECRCRDSGFQMVDGRCQDVDECTFLGACHPDAECSNTHGTYMCKCREGYHGDGQDCQDVDECIQDGFCAADEEEFGECSPNVCSPNAICMNVLGSYDCECYMGFTGDGSSCSDVDECILGTHTCSPLAECSNTEGSFTCQCNQGYMGDGFFCDDVDECSDLNSAVCHPLASCSNTDGSYTCTCCAGYTGTGTDDCQDIDECDLDTHTCAFSSNCTNTPGSFDCGCPDGYQGDGVDCTDIDECSLPEPPCSRNADCTNLQGGFDCTCKPGFTGDGIFCDRILACPLVNPCSGNGQCEEGDNSYTCNCYSGWTGDNCETDIDDCASLRRPCFGRGECVDGNGTFTCICRFPWTPPRCKRFIGRCSWLYCFPGGRCVSLPNGQRRCICFPGWTGPRCDRRIPRRRRWRSIQGLILRIILDITDPLTQEDIDDFSEQLNHHVHQSMARSDIVVYNWKVLNVKRGGSLVFEVLVTVLYLDEIDPPSLQLLNEALGYDYLIEERPDLPIIPDGIYFLESLDGLDPPCEGNGTEMCEGSGSTCQPYYTGYYCLCDQGLLDDDTIPTGRRCTVDGGTTTSSTATPPTATQTTAIPTPPPTVSPRVVGAIIGGSVGSLVVITIFTCILLVVIRRRQRRLRYRKNPETPVTSLEMSTMAPPRQTLIWRTSPYTASAPLAAPLSPAPPPPPITIIQQQIVPHVTLQYPGKFMWRTRDNPFPSGRAVAPLSAPVMEDDYGGFYQEPPQARSQALFQAPPSGWFRNQRQEAPVVGQQVGQAVPRPIFWRSVVNQK